MDFGKNKVHTIDALLGYTVEKTRNQRVAMAATGFATDDIQTLNAATVYELASEGNGNTAGTGTFRYPDVVLESYLGRINYSYLGRYLLSTSLRLDRSSLFSKGNRNAWFPSVSLGWRVNEEKFMKNIKAISNLKLRASYGVTGNNRISYNAALEVLNSANYVTGKGTGALVNGSANISSSLANSNITWEQTDEFNYGLDLGLFNNRINLAIDAYYSVTRALLFEQPTQSFTGYTHYWNNIGKVRNSGLEIQLDTHNMKSRKFSWDTNINFSLSRNKLLELGGEQQMISLGERNEGYLAKVGEPLIQFYGYKTCGVWNSAEEIAANPHFSDDAPGGIRIVDTNNDGSLTPEDRVALGTPYPDFTWGITNTFQIKDFDISFLIQGVQGITDMIYNPGLINVDFADIQTVMRDKGIAHIGMGVADEELEAIKTAMESPLLETTVAGATDVIVNFAGAVGMLEAQQAVEYLKDEAGDDVNVIFGTVNADFGDQISATIIATGIKSADITGNARTGFAAAKKPVQQTQQAPEFSGQPLHNGKVMEEEQPVQTTSYVSEPEMKEIEQESSKINIPEFLLKSRRR